MSLLSWLKKNTARDDAWITVHPNAGGKGSPVLLDDEGYIKGGMGGKFTGQRIDLMPRKNGYGVPASENDLLNKSTPGFLRTSRYTLKAPQNIASQGAQNIEAVQSSSNGTFQRVETKVSRHCENSGVKYNEVQPRGTDLSDDEIIDLVGGGDKTEGSCSSAALAYLGQKLGFDVRDFRGGDSRLNFSIGTVVDDLFHELGADMISESTGSALSNATKVLRKVENGKMYHLSCGRHATIVRRNGRNLQFLELQSPYINGWKNFKDEWGSVEATLKNRFGCSKTDKTAARLTDTSGIKGDAFRTVLGYINTPEAEQQKGADGSVK